MRLVQFELGFLFALCFFVCVVLYCLRCAFLFAPCFFVCVGLFCLRCAFLFAFCIFVYVMLFLFTFCTFLLALCFFVCVFFFCLCWPFWATVNLRLLIDRMRFTKIVKLCIGPLVKIIIFSFSMLGQLAKQPTLEKSDSLGTKSRRKRLWDYLGGRRSKQTRGIQCGMSQRGLV